MFKKRQITRPTRLACRGGRADHRSQIGFTLIELLISMVIITTITALSIANYRSSQKQKQVGIAADTVINAIRNAQNFSLAGRNTNDANPNCRVAQYYAITISYNSNPTLSAFNNCNTTDQIETYPLPASTRIKASGLTLDNSTATASVTIVFYAPYGNLKGAVDNAAYSTFTTATITVENIDSSAQKAVTVDGVVGRIE